MTPALPRDLPVERIEKGAVLYRAHAISNSPIYFGPADGESPTHRFHAPDGSYKTCFIGRSEDAAFVEGIIHGPVPARLLSRSSLAKRVITELHVLEPILLAPLYGPYLIGMGATAAITHGEDYALSQPWGKAIHDHARRVDGILYTSRHDETTFSLALFSRSERKIAAGNSHPLTAFDLRTLWLLDRYGLGLTG